VPILILFIPIFDTTLVTILRKLAGRAASQGGRDHTSHRLVALGMSERRAVWMLYGFAGIVGVAGIGRARDGSGCQPRASARFVVLLTLLGVYLAGVKVYEEEELAAAREKPLFAFLIDLSYKRRLFEVLLDVVLIILAYYSAYALLFGSWSQGQDWQLFLRTLPLLVVIKMAMFLVMGVYRGIWRYTSVDDLIVFAKAVFLGSIASILAILFTFRFEGFSRTVFALDGMLLLMMVAGSRFTFRLLRKLLPASPESDGRRVLIYGAGDAGELLLRELRNNPELRYTPVGFVDDDPLKKDKVIHGLRVLAATAGCRAFARRKASRKCSSPVRIFPKSAPEKFLRHCEEARVTVSGCGFTSNN
jgi:UDP-GlcNAc:undecaprenyl-phosphate GlcNAc-1-phosphate transferase